MRGLAHFSLVYTIINKMLLGKKKEENNAQPKGFLTITSVRAEFCLRIIVVPTPSTWHFDIYLDRWIKVNSQSAPSQDSRVQGPSLPWHQAGQCEGQFDDGDKQWSVESSTFPYQVSLQPCISWTRKTPSEWLPDCSILSFLCLLWPSGFLMMGAWNESLHFPSEFLMLFHRRENSSWIQPKSERESSGNS